MIGPIKQEEVYDKPQIWVYYDVITDNQIEIFKKLALPKVRKFDLVLLHSQIRVYEVKIITPS